MKGNNSGGFTLIETAIVISLLAVISFGIASFIMTSIQAWLLISQRDAVVGRSRTAMNRMVYELRRIKKPQNILTSEAAEVGFLDLDSQIVDFKQSGATLLRNADILATGLASPEGLRFTYLDATGEVTAVKQDMRSIRILLVLTSGTQLTTLESAARIRNLQ
jgi:prepilin-type N-terminal cleavage/methylation domain-containing protein